MDHLQLFLLPFNEVATFSLLQPLQLDHEPNGYKHESHTKSLFAKSVLNRTTDQPLENATLQHCDVTQFTLEQGCFVLLRPVENSLRPSVAKVVHFFTLVQNRKQRNYARVQWFYRAEDLVDKPTQTIGEDEVFQTEHFDDIDIQAIAGRCQISSYVDWLRETTHFNQGNSQPPQNTNRVDAIDIDARSDVESSFGDNYSSASVQYYCKSFYDPIRQKFVTSTFEDPSIDPVEQLEGKTAQDEDFFPTGDAYSSDEGDISDDSFSETEHKRTKKRPRRPKIRANTEHSQPERASQFSLPTDSGVPEILPCRDEQKGRVKTFLENAIKESAEGGHGGSRCLYISGVPGTGKTATVREVIRALSERRVRGEVAPFEAIEVNAMSLPDPNLVYSELYSAITGSRGMAPMHAAQLLEKRFSEEQEDGTKKGRAHTVGRPTARERGKCIILILDEMDVLVSRKQKVLYDMLEWPTRKDAKMAVIGIANTMDLPERMLPRLGSRLGLNRLTYPPYSSDQLITILNLKLQERKDVKFAPSAIKLCAQKVGAVSGDVRRALEIIRRAVELVEKKKGKRNTKKTVGADDINRAVNDIAGGSRLVAIKQLSLFERLFLVCAVSLARSEGSFAMDVTCSVESISSKAVKEANRHSQHFDESGIPTTYELEEACWRLCAQRIILLEQTAAFKTSRVVVNVSADDCSFALQDCQLSMRILNPKNGP